MTELKQPLKKRAVLIILILALMVSWPSRETTKSLVLSWPIATFVTKGLVVVIPLLSMLPFETINAYDKPFFPANRSRFNKSWISQPESHSLGIMQNGKQAGYGVIRKCRNGYKIGPLFVDNPELAESLFLALKSRISSSESIFLDTPEINQAVVALA